MGFLSIFQRRLPLDTQKIEQAIAHLEQHTSAELRVVVERRAKKCTSAIARANQLFHELQMAETAQRNGVLIYLSFKPHYVAVVGDEGIHQKVGEAFWQNIYQAMKADCQQGNFTDGICKAIQQIEQPLAEYFPILPDDKNELANEVVIR
ncbi:hypothetical protein A4G19_00525 [Pasteurellaceae bacterium Macca]|nr:hypothetical protein [Pasteurellaceae bacterium Macca]